MSANHANVEHFKAQLPLRNVQMKSGPSSALEDGPLSVYRSKIPNSLQLLSRHTRDVSTIGLVEVELIVRYAEVIEIVVVERSIVKHGACWSDHHSI